MLIFEVILTVLFVAAVPLLLLGWVFRPLGRWLARRWRLEGKAAEIRRGLEREQAAARAECSHEAAAEVATWLNLPEARELIDRAGGDLRAAVDPVLQAVLERHPLDERVVELAWVYRQATGRELFPEALTGRAREAEPARVPRAPLTEDERRMLQEARREVECWQGGSAGSGDSRARE